MWPSTKVKVRRWCARPRANRSRKSPGDVKTARGSSCTNQRLLDITWLRTNRQRVRIFHLMETSQLIKRWNGSKGSTPPVGNDLTPRVATTEAFHSAAVQQAPPPLTPASAVHAGKSREVESFHGEVLRLYHVTRKMMGAYMCIASNEVPPAVSKRVSLNVNCKCCNFLVHRFS